MAKALVLAAVLAAAFVAAPHPNFRVDRGSISDFGYAKAWAWRGGDHHGDRDRGGRGHGDGWGGGWGGNGWGGGGWGGNGLGGNGWGGNGWGGGGDNSGSNNGGGDNGGSNNGGGDNGGSNNGGGDNGGGDNGGGNNGGGDNSGSGGHGGKGGHGSKGHTGSGDNSDTGNQPGKSDKNDKHDKNDKKDKNNPQATSETTDTPAKDKTVAAKDKSHKKGKPTKPAELPVVEVPAVSVPNTSAGGGSPAAGDHKAGEVVGVGMSSADVATVSAMGFAVATPTTAILTTPVVQILVPRDVDEEEARAALSKALPGRRFGLNKVYSGYETATSAKSASATVHEGPPGADPRCIGDQCYGRVMIGWQPQLEACQAGVSIGMIDTGIDVAHPAFAGGTFVVRSFSPPGTKEEGYGHATGVAALLIGNGHDSSPGLLPKARLVAADVFYVEGKHVVTDTASLLRALDWFDQPDVGVGIVNMSFSGPEDPLVAEAIERMSKKGVVFVAAAGNNGPGAPFAYPAAYPSVIAVTAVDARMKSYIKANHGDYIDVAAPGVKIWTATSNGRSGYQSGTSFAVPFVTAALAAGSAFGAPEAAEKWLTSAGLDDIGEPGTDNVFGRGLLRAPAGCGAKPSGGGLLSSILPDVSDDSTATIRSGLGMAQR